MIEKLAASSVTHPKFNRPECEMADLQTRQRRVGPHTLIGAGGSEIA
jgi:hypothetical protein